MSVLLWFIGLFTAWMAYGVVSTYFRGSLYKGVHLPLALGSFALFAVVPPLAGLIFG
jgi:hypothetical protein